MFLQTIIVQYELYELYAWANVPELYRTLYVGLTDMQLFGTLQISR